MQHIASSNYRRIAWKNGGGETMEVAISPPEVGIDNFDWRISIATIVQDGPFSPFPEIDRTILVQSGAGMALTIDGVERKLTCTDEPFRFSGESSTTCRLLSGPVADINVMSRRGVCLHEVTRIAAKATVAARAQTFVLAVTALSLAVPPMKIGASDLLVLEPGESLTIANGHALAIRFTRSGASSHV